MKRLGLLVALIVMATLPFWMNSRFLHQQSAEVLIYAILALGLNVLVGYAGLFSIEAHAGAILTTMATAR